MANLIASFCNDTRGFVVSAELVLIGTIAVLGMVVGLSEVAFNVNQELEDVGSAFGSINQTYQYSASSGHKGNAVGSLFHDSSDVCDGECDIRCDSAPLGEGYHAW